jgi:transposase
MRVFIGLDVSLAKTAICVVDRDGAVQWQGKVPSEPGPIIERLAGWFGNIELAGIEACPLSEWLHRALREAGVPIVCIETRQAQRFLSSRPVKTDKNDARGIAEMMRLGHYRPVHVKSLAAQSMRTTLVARMQLVSSQLQIEGTIRGLLRVYGLKIGAIHRNASPLGWPIFSRRRRSRNCRRQSSRCCGYAKSCAPNGRRRIGPWPVWPDVLTSVAA